MMPRYHLHIHTGEIVEEDREGTDFTDLDAAHATAERVIRNICIAWCEAQIDMMMVIADESGRTVRVIPFESVIGPTQ
jgi:hypothetical protein